MKSDLVTIIALISFTACTSVKKAVQNTITESHRPEFHFTPAEKWMNDPNGMVYHKAFIICFSNIILILPNGAQCTGAMLQVKI